MPQPGDNTIVMLKYLDSDPGHAPPDARTLMQGWKFTPEEPLLDGPVSRRVAVIDFDPVTGAGAAGAKFVPPKDRAFGYYQIADERDVDSAGFKQVSVFTAVLKMMDIFEAPDVLGRKLRWAFDGEQLLVVPRAGKMPNAFYHRDSRSLQFFFIDDPAAAGKTVYTCLSPDIVAHETTHAILDGIAPDLYNATSPQSLAMHEAIADLGAVMLAVDTDRLKKKVMAETRGDIRKAEAFNSIAQQFGAALYGAGRPLRDLFNKMVMPVPSDRARNEPHTLSTVLTGALYALLVCEYEEIQQEDFEKKRAVEQASRAEKGLPAPDAAEEADFRFSVSGFALFKASEKFKRIAFRALDYLPPGEICFADYGRAMVAADTHSNPDDSEPRDFIKAEFARRGMVADPASLEPVDPGFTLPQDLDLDLLVRSDWAAYRFAEEWRDKLLIPAGLPFEVRPRLDVTRTTWRKGGAEGLTRALLFKVAWQTVQAVPRYGDLFQEFAVARGTMLAIDWQTRKVACLLSTSDFHPSQVDASTSSNNAMRATFIEAGLEDGVLELGSPNVQIQNGILRIRAMGQMLHMMGH
ncbi:hypothetical protein [Xanthobacter autotrophicus]|uniref:hypothetical protein n=1 Tax=Xanthobacter autotrophicus TaxID=280 RepID=UPI003728D006